MLKIQTLVRIHNWVHFRMVTHPQIHHVHKCACIPCRGLVITSFPEKSPLCAICEKRGCLCNEC